MAHGLPTKGISRLVLLVATLLVAIGASGVAEAQLPMGWTSVRALGMGNAYTSVADDADALMYNPAMLARIRGVHWRIMNPRAGIDNPSNLQLANKLSNVTDVASTVNSLYGTNIWAGAGGMSAVTVPYFGFGIYANSEAGILATTPPYAELNADYYFDYGAVLGLALPVVPDFMAFGVTVRSINRTGTTASIGPATLATNNANALNSQFKSRGNAVGVDTGVIFYLPVPTSPTFAFTYRDVGNTMFSWTEGAGAPPSVQSEMIAGASVKFDLPLITVTPSMDYRYIGWTGVATGMNLGMGVEISLPLIDIRGGLSQGYYTAGAGLNIGMIKVDAATWAVEMGAYPGQQVDRRYMAQLTIQLGFDPSLFWGGSGSSGDGSSSSEHRHLKQRR